MACVWVVTCYYNKQWGVTEQISGNASKIVVFPLAYTTFSHWVANSRSSSTNESSWCTGGYNGTLTGFTARSNGTPIEWIATGLQQWGYVEDTSARTISLQIALAKNLYCVVADESISASSLIKTTTSFTIYTSGAAWGRYAPQKFHWVAIGFQQWGNITTAVNDGTVTFPIAYVTNTYFATADPMDDANYHTNNVGIYNRTNKSFDFVFYQGHIIRAWFAIGY